jgi:L-Ala-D/L-Glu epimerase
VVSISAALHLAFSSPLTEYIDLDGSFDLAKDIAEGGFVLKNGSMWLTDEKGLGVKLID